MAKLPLEIIFRWQTYSAMRHVSTQNICFFSSLKKKLYLFAQRHSLLWVYNRNQIAEVSALNSLLKVSSAILLIGFSSDYHCPCSHLKKKKVSYTIWKPFIHSPSTSELQRAGVSIDEVGVLSTPFEYLGEGGEPNIFGLWDFLYSKTAGDFLLWPYFISLFSWKGRRKR